MSKSGYLVTLHGRLTQWDDMKRDEKNIAICNELMKRNGTEPVVAKVAIHARAARAAINI